MDIAEFSDERLVAIYDTVNAYEPGTQPEFYLELAAELSASSIIDLGCGTGLITREFAKRDFRMVGIDPAPGMIEVARRRPYGDRVHWIVGDASKAAGADADLAIMTGHVAQFFLTDESWRAALAALRNVLRPGGWLAFESRNPAAREWESWTRSGRWTVQDPQAGSIETWAELHEVRDGVVEYANHYRFLDTGEELLSASRLRFRTLEELGGTLSDAGFVIERVYGDWKRAAPGPDSPELIVVARSVP